MSVHASFGCVGIDADKGADNLFKLFFFFFLNSIFYLAAKRYEKVPPVPYKVLT
jgi:hypothetical protein